jgi:hypothetical protein
MCVYVLGMGDLANSDGILFVLWTCSGEQVNRSGLMSQTKTAEVSQIHSLHS